MSSVLWKITNIAACLNIYLLCSFSFIAGSIFGSLLPDTGEALCWRLHERWDEVRHCVQCASTSGIPPESSQGKSDRIHSGDSLLILSQSLIVQFLNKQETVSNVKVLKACMMIIKDGKLDLKTLRQGLVAFNLMERYLQYFEDNLRERFN